MAQRDYYEILGIARSADEKEIKSAFRKLAMQYHPDKNPGNKEAEQKFKEINEAYDVLKDSQKRSAYDRFGHAAFTQGGGGNAGGGYDFNAGGASFSDIFDDLFGDFMGGGGGRRAGAGGNGGGSAASRGADLRYNLDISLEDAFKGKNAQITITTAVACDSCDGSGAAKGTSPTTCTTCQGRGRVRTQQGFFTVERTCPTCHGQGQMIKDPCKSCGGSGRKRKDKTLAVNIPAGVEDGTRIRLSGEGEIGSRGGQAGDLYIFLSLRPHPFFKRDGADLHCKVPIRMTTAALGGSIEVPTIEGTRAKLTIPAGTQSGAQFRLRGKGMSVMRSAVRGDMYIHAQIETPRNLSKKQKDILKEFDKDSDKNSPESESFFSKVKEFWDDLKE